MCENRETPAAPTGRETGGPEGRRSIKENAEEANPSRTQSREIGSRGLAGAREGATSPSS
jgi:hypothetical protein